MTHSRTEKNPNFPQRVVIKTASLDPAEWEIRINRALDILIDEARRAAGRTRKLPKSKAG